MYLRVYKQLNYEYYVYTVFMAVNHMKYDMTIGFQTIFYQIRIIKSFQ
jgi:hypothetical protein